MCSFNTDAFFESIKRDNLEKECKSYLDALVDIKTIMESTATAKEKKQKVLDIFKVAVSSDEYYKGES